MPEFHRVRDKETGHEYSVTVVDETRHDLLKDEPALDVSGQPLAPKLAGADDIDAPPAPGTVVVAETPTSKKTAAAAKPAAKTQEG